MNPKCNEVKPLYTEIIEWDVANWSKGLDIWCLYIPEDNNWTRGLELGANRGGLSLYFSKMTKAKIVCSDYPEIPEKAREFHQRKGLSDRIVYAAIDAAQLPYPDNTFDFVCFKSILGIVGQIGKDQRQNQAVQEILRVLKPGGKLFFMENLVGSPLHKLARKFFIRWGTKWNYIPYNRMKNIAGQGQVIHFESHGFFTAFVRKENRLKSIAHAADKVLGPILPKKMRYVATCVIAKSE